VVPGGEPTLPNAEDLYNSAPTGLLVIGTTGTILRVNTTFCTWLGRERADLVGKVKLQDLFTMGARIFHQTHWQPLLEMQGSLSEVKFELLHKDGTRLPMLLNAIRRKNGGDSFDEVSVAIALERNKYEKELVTQRKRADGLAAGEQQAKDALHLTQERLRLALTAGELYPWTYDVQTQKMCFEDDVAHLLGHTAPRSVSDEAFNAAVDPRDKVSHQAALKAALQNSTHAHHWSCRLLGVDGVRREVRFAGRGFFAPSGELAQFVGVLHDVTETANEHALALDRALFAEQLVGIVSHDMRNPLFAIRMGAAMLARTELPPNRAGVVKQIKESAENAMRMVGDLLDFTVTRVGKKLSISRSAIDLHEAVRKAVNEVSSAHPSRVVIHNFDGDEQVKADGGRLAQAAGNLVANAITYGSTEHPITVTSVSDTSGFQVSVHNHGTPIPVHVLTTIFDAMTRGEVDEMGVRSVGLGLFIVREIARGHDGDVTVTSTALEGTTFVIRVSSSPREL
jgi:sigma-B regulation protein RsbU (phosphoserine phosphatase)